ncbi:hypothetical protein [Streptomyces sp. AC627_RSS907]|uniref:hypothetical protein n=1 Tax=Streptomyces sp. AC627_RSS907 TaxID=2823684 RepID=UPI001C226A23|nr:hypothetical protein [Streptomyces sp. AC627_RSS907]
MSDWLIEEIVLFLVVGAVVVATIWLVAVKQRSKAELARDTSYRTIAERAVATQEAMQRDLANMDARMAKIERVLKDVD